MGECIHYEGMTEKKCMSCLEVKKLADFIQRKRSKRTTYYSECRDCFNIRRRAARAEPEYKERERNANRLRMQDVEWVQHNRDNRLRTRYGIDRLIWAKMFEDQLGICANDNCSALATDTDHCHTTMKVRGLLCGFCNKALGTIKDDVSRLKGLIRYLGSEV